MKLPAAIHSLLFAALVLVNGEQLSSATTLTSDLKVSLVIADHCSISTKGAAPAVECDGSSVYRVYDRTPFAVIPVSEANTAERASAQGQPSGDNDSRPKVEIAF